MNKKIHDEISRRNLLRFLGNSAVFLPFMRTLMETQVFAETSQKRAVFFYYPDGIIEPQFHPAATGSTFTLPAMTKPLADVQNDIIMIKNLDYKTSNSHQGGANYALSGWENEIKGVSIDTYLGAKLAAQIPAVRLGVGTLYEGNDIGKGISFSAAGGTRSLMEDNPTQAFNSLFGGSSPVGPSPANQTSPVNSAAPRGLSAGLKKSLFDDNLEQIKGLQNKLGTIEKTKLDMHIASIRELERRLQSAATPGGSTGAPPSAQCTKTISQKQSFDVKDTNYPRKYWLFENFDVVADMQIELAIQALACGVTNVAYVQMSHSVSNTLFENGAPGKTGFGHHDASHETGAREAEHVANQFYMMSKFAKLVKGMGQIKEGDKSLLYNSAVMAFSELGDSRAHSFTNMGLVLAGQAGGYFKTGRCVDANPGKAAKDVKDYCHNNLLVSILESMGLPDTTFGRTDVKAGGIPSLKG